MAKWKYTLKNGEALRKAIYDEDSRAVLDTLAKCCAEVYDHFPDEYDEYQYNEDIEDISNQLDNLENYADYDMSYEDVEDEINYLLTKFYDLCDYLRIWVAL